MSRVLRTVSPRAERTGRRTASEVSGRVRQPRAGDAGPVRTVKRPLSRRLVDLAFWLIVLCSTVVILSVVSGRKLFDRLDEEIRDRVQTELALRFPDLRVKVGRARRIDGQGIEVDDVEFYERPAEVGLTDSKVGSPRQDTGVAANERLVGVIDHALLHCATDLTDLAKGDLQPASLEIDGIHLRLTQRSDGAWNLDHLAPRGDDGEPIPIFMRDVRVTLTTKTGAPMRLADIQLDVLPLYMEDTAYPVATVTGKMGSGVSQLTLEGRIDPQEKTFIVSLAAPRQEIRPDLLSLCAELGAPVDNWSARGVLHDIHATLSGGPNQPLRYRLSCELRGARVEHAQLPAALDNLQARINIDSEQIRLQQAHATVAGASLYMPDLLWDMSQQRLKTSLSVRGLRFDERLGKKLPERLRKSWEAHNALGEVVEANWSFERTAADGVIQNSLHVDCRDLSFQFPSLPYRFHRAEGNFVMNGERLAVNLRAPVSGQQVQIVGDIRGAGSDAPYGWMELKTEGAVSLDEEMIRALSPTTQKAVRSFQPRGKLNLSCYVQRTGPGAPLQKQTVVHLENLAVQYSRLPYPVNRIQGTMRMTDGAWTIEVHGRNDDAQITCRGHWHEDIDVNDQLQLRFQCKNVSLDSELRMSLPTSTQRLWGQMNPRGALDDVVVDLNHDKRRHVTQTHITMWKLPASRIEATAAPAMSLHLPGLPYRLEQVTGKVTHANGSTLLEDIRGIHGDTTWEAEGRTLSRDGKWSVDLTRLVADNLTMDRGLLGCLPATVAPNVSQLQLRGPIDIDGQVSVQGVQSVNGDTPSWARQANWDLTLDIENGAIRFGELPVDKIRGQLRMRGAAKAGRFAINGELNVDTLESRGTTVHHVKGPLSMDNRSLRLGTWANSETPRQLTARILGGDLTGDAEFKLDGSQEFELTAALSNGQLSDIARRTLPVGGRVAGQATGQLLLSGSTRGLHTFKGEGYAEMQNADIYEAPVMASLLQLFSARDSDKSLISNGNASFRIVGDRIYLDNLELDGAIRLKGGGEMTIQRQLDLTLYTAMRGRDNDPSLMLFREASRRILEIEVGGSLERPVITRRAFPELNDTLQRLFPEASGRRSVAGGLPYLRGRLLR